MLPMASNESNEPAASAGSVYHPCSETDSTDIDCVVDRLGALRSSLAAKIASNAIPSPWILIGLSHESSTLPSPN